MNFALLTSHNGTSWGGSEELWSATAAELARQGHAVRVAIPPGYAAHPRVTALRAARVEVTVLETPPPGWGTRLARRGLPARWQAAPVDPLQTWLERCRAAGTFVLVSLPGFRSNIRRLAAAGIAQTRYACVSHGNHPTDWIPDAELADFRRFFLAAEFSAFVSTDARAFAENALGRALPRGCIVRNPFRVDWDHAPEFPATADALHVAMMAELNFGTKGQDLIVELLAREKWRTRPVIVTCHGDGSNRELLADWIQRLQLANLRIAGHTADVTAAWSRAHLGLMASRHEGMPIAMVEGMLCGRPFVSTAVGGCRELVLEGRTGFLAAHPTVDDLDAALERAWQARAGLAALGQAARRHVQALLPRDPAAQFAQLVVTAATRA